MFTPKPFMSKIREFLMTYPELEPLKNKEDTAGDKLFIEYLKTTPKNSLNPEGYAVAVVGTNILSRKPDIAGNVLLRKRANFQFLIKRYTEYNEERRDTGDFIINFCDWINTENELKTNPKLPKFSDTYYEMIIADGGMAMGTDVEPQVGTVDLFILQIHIEFETYYKLA